MRSIWDSSGAGADDLSCSKNRKKRIKKIIVVVVESVNLGRRPVFPHNRAVCRLFWRWEEMEQNL